MSEKNGIRRYDYVELYVGSARMWAYWMANGLGLTLNAYLGPETGHRDRTSFYLTGGDLKMVVTSALRPSNQEVAGFVEEHGDGVRRWSLEVDDVGATFEEAVRNGAVPTLPPQRFTDADGTVVEAAIKLYDTCEIRFVNRDQYRGLFRPGFQAPRHAPRVRREPTGLGRIDHIVGNVRQNEMDAWATYFNRALGFETFIDFKAGDIGTRYSALLSKVVRSPDGRIKNPINEPYQGLMKSQIEEFLEEFRGSGVQHIALETEDILATVRALRANGVEFLEAPATYYELLRSRKDLRITERIEDLEKLGILCDQEGKGYLLQLFTRPIGDRPTLFFEIIQRRNGASGFGRGNFQALFEAIELDQKRRGNLEREAGSEPGASC